jgi:hypothetical protein
MFTQARLPCVKSYSNLTKAQSPSKARGRESPIFGVVALSEHSFVFLLFSVPCLSRRIYGTQHDISPPPCPWRSPSISLQRTTSFSGCDACVSVTNMLTKRRLSAFLPLPFSFVFCLVPQTPFDTRRISPVQVLRLGESKPVFPSPSVRTQLACHASCHQCHASIISCAILLALLPMPTFGSKLGTYMSSKAM